MANSSSSVDYEPIQVDGSFDPVRPVVLDPYFYYIIGQTMVEYADGVTADSDHFAAPVDNYGFQEDKENNLLYTEQKRYVDFWDNGHIIKGLSYWEFVEDYVTQPEVDKAGYTLEGWYTDKELTDRWDFSADKLERSVDTFNLYARWELIPATAPDLPAQQDIQIGCGDDEYDITAPDFEKLDGYEYAYEWKDAEGNTVGEDELLTVTLEKGGDAVYTLTVTAERTDNGQKAYSQTAFNVTRSDHEWGGWEYDETHHYKECAQCKAVTDEAAHEFEWVTDREPNGTQPGSKHEECTICGYEKDPVEIPGAPADATAPDLPAQQDIQIGCGDDEYDITAPDFEKLDGYEYAYEWKDAEGNTVGEDELLTVTLEKGGDAVYTLTVTAERTDNGQKAYSQTAFNVTRSDHEWGGWEYDETHHYKECAQCNAVTDEAAHEFEWVTDKEPNGTQPGSKHEECTICGYEKDPVEIPGAPADATAPDLPAQQDIQIGCGDDEYDITAPDFEKLDGYEYAYEWKDAEGNTVGEDELLTVTLEKGGDAVYTLTVTAERTDNGQKAYSQTAFNVTRSDHEWGGWEYDETHHYKECAQCKAVTDEAAHEFEWVTDREPNGTQPGSKHEECTICGYEKDPVEIPGAPADAPDDTDDETTDTPKTGQPDEMTPWLIVLAFSAAGMTGAMAVGRKKNIF